jgi:3-hydroxy-9,10-secoandrosta-1,3,5(10)-triene-9,17-dione monooxygenase reductase component
MARADAEEGGPARAGAEEGGPAWAPPACGDQGGGAGGTEHGLDVARYREVLGHFATGVTVVTTVDRGVPVGFTCQAFAALSLEPPLVAFAPAKTSATWPRIERSGVFCVNVLAEHQEALCRLFATKGDRKFEGVGWRPAATGSPILLEVLAFVDCRLHAVYEGGDHLLAVGKVVDLGVGSGGPLLFYRGGFGRFVP